MSVLCQIHSWRPCQEINKLGRDITICACHSGTGNGKNRKCFTSVLGCKQSIWGEPQSCFDRHSHLNRRCEDGESKSVFAPGLQTDVQPSQRFSEFRSGLLSSWTAHSSCKFKVVTPLLQRQPQVCPSNFYPLNELVYSLCLPPCWAGITRVDLLRVFHIMALHNRQRLSSETAAAGGLVEAKTQTFFCMSMLQKHVPPPHSRANDGVTWA